MQNAVSDLPIKKSCERRWEMKHCCKNCPNYDPWERKLPGGYNDEYWGEPGEPISEEEQKKFIEFAVAFGNAAAKTTSDLFKKTMEKALRKEAEKENKNSISKYGHSVSFTKKDLFGGN
jgi:hypothetical protein